MKFKLTDYLPETMIVVIAIFLMALFISRILVWTVNKRIGKKGDEDASVTGLKFLRNTIRFLIWTGAVIAIIFTIPQLKSVAVTLFAGAGILAVIIGFAAQAALGNIISGVFIVIFKPFRVGDIINVGAEYRGSVSDITLRHTVLRDFRNRRIIMPNSTISSQTVINDSIDDPSICRWIDIAIAYDADIDKAILNLRDVVESHPKCLDRRTPDELAGDDPKVNIRVVELGEYSILLRAFAWAKNAVEAFDLHTDVNYLIRHRFEEEGIEIPYPHRTLVFKGPGPTSSLSD